MLIAVPPDLDLSTLDDIKLSLGCEIEPVLSSKEEIEKKIRKYYGVGAETIEEMAGKVERLELLTEEKDLNVPERESSVVKFVNQIFLQAVNDRATDIHLEPYEKELRVRFRIDGLLYEVNLPLRVSHFKEAIISRVKVMASLNIGEKRLPQDGRAKIRIDKEDYDLRISVLPTHFGESINIRILSRRVYTLGELGLSEDDLSKLDRAIKKPHGIILVTGPTGSGKTTTLYACLSKINSEEKKIITVEDPIEYQIKGITQMQVKPKINFTFANALRSMLRHDPDIMMVGEIRDTETAELTIRTALTGHLVFSTLHTNDACGAIARLLDMGIEPFLLSSSLEAVIAQLRKTKIEETN